MSSSFDGSNAERWPGTPAYATDAAISWPLVKPTCCDVQFASLVLHADALSRVTQLTNLIPIAGVQNALWRAIPGPIHTHVRPRRYPVWCS